MSLSFVWNSGEEKEYVQNSPLNAKMTFDWIEKNQK